MNSQPLQATHKTSYNDKPLTVNFQANNICNSKCLMCNIWQLKKQDEILVSEFRKLLSDPFFSEVQNVGITGGEPTLRDDLFELYEILPAVLPKLKGASFITNGLLFEKTINVYSRINDFYSQKGLSFGGMVSIDGVGEVHDKVRGKKDAFEKTSKALFGLRSRGVQVTVCCTIVKENVYGIHDLLAWCKSNNFYVRFRIAEFINRLYNENLDFQIRNFDEYEIKHLVSFFHLLITEYENDESVKATYYSILSLLTGGKRIVECPYQNLDAINLDSEGSYSVCAPKGKLHKCGNDISADVKAGFEERLFIKSNYCDNCIHDYHSIYIPEVKSDIESGNQYDSLMFYNSPLPFITSENQNTEIDLLKMNKILLVGWYGTETAGDIAILNGIIQEYKSINPELKFVLFSLYPFYSKTTLNNLNESITILDYHGKYSYQAIQDCDAIVMAGGPLMDIPQTKLIAALFKLFYDQKKPGIIEGCGIGPLNVEQYRENVIQIAMMASKIRVRDSASSELLKKYGIQKKIEVRTDPSTSFIKSLELENQTKEKVIRCFLRELTDEYPQGISSETAFKNITGFIQKLLEWYPEFSIELMAMHYFPVGKDDREFAKRIVNEVNDNRLSFDIKPRTPEEILKAMSSAYFCISMRFHSVVFASAINCKFIAIDYTAGGKIKGFLTDTNQLSRIIYLNQLPIINKNKFEKMLNNRALLELSETQQEEIKDLKIIHLTSVDKGGAGIAAYRLHKGLLKNEYDSTFLVLSKSRDDESIKKIEDLIYQNEQENFWLNQWNNCQESAKKYSNKPEGFEVFTDINSEINLSNVNEIKNSDIINLHWTAGLLDSDYMQLAFFEKPVVWTLHDMNAFTGGCHYSDGCEKYKHGCGGCPQLGSLDENDLSHKIWLKKSEAYKNLNLTIVTPSKWLADCAAQSPLFFNFPIVVIPNGFPLDIYKPVSDCSENEAPEILEKKKLILFGADYETDRKGFKYLVSALELLSKKIVDYKISLGVFGYYPADFKIPDNCTLINYQKISDENELAKIYGNADVFVLPSIEDNLPNVVIEALACGTPVVGFNIGGVKEQVEHKINGYLANTKDVTDLAEGIHWLLFESNYSELKQNCRSKAVKEYSSENQVKSYAKLYRKILENFRFNSTPINTVCNDLFKQAEELIQESQFSKSKAILTFLLEKEPSNQNYLNDLAVNHILLKEYESANQVIERVLSVNPKNEVAIENLVYVKQQVSAQSLLETAEEDIQQGRYLNARQILNTLIKDNPNYVDALNDLAVIEILEEETQKAIITLNKVCKIDPVNEIALGNIDYINSNNLIKNKSNLSSENSNTITDVTNKSELEYERLQSNWNTFGKKDPMWAILTDPTKRDNKWQPGEFFETGINNIELVIKYTKQLNLNINYNKAIDFGCGIGRLTQALAMKFNEVIGIDIAPSMINAAEYHNRFKQKCKYVLNNKYDLSFIPSSDIDFIYTIITLQHMKPKFSKGFIQEFMRVLKKDGVLIFQIPSRRKNQPFLNEQKLDEVQSFDVANPVMEMHGVLKDEVIKLLTDCGGKIIHIEDDKSLGEDWESFKYCVQKL